jgi:Na+/H+-dicarboxylate symporter
MKTIKSLSQIKQLIMPIILISILCSVFSFGTTLDLTTKRFLLSVSLAIKSCILLVLPFFIIVFVARALMQMRKKALKYFLLLTLFVFASNFIAVSFGYGFFHLISSYPNHHFIAPIKHELIPLYPVAEFQIISNTHGLFLGFILGIALSFSTSGYMENTLERAQGICNLLLRFLVIPLLPFLILGFAIKTQHEGVLETSAAGYGKILLNFILAQLCYVIILLTIASGFKAKKSVSILGKVIPATITGFSTFSSAATMPVTISCAEKILTDKSIAKLFVPATVNIHLVGTAIGMNIIILSCITLYGSPVPSYQEFLPFSFFFAVMMFAVVGVPGGSVFIIAPLIEQYLGVGTEAIALITALVLLFDPIDTSFNTTINAISARLFEKFYNLIDSLKFFKLKRLEEPEIK